MSQLDAERPLDAAAQTASDVVSGNGGAVAEDSENDASAADLENNIEEAPEFDAEDSCGTATDEEGDIAATAEGNEIDQEEAEEQDPLAAAQAEAAEHYDRFLRTAAELENYRKRSTRIRAETRDEALRDVILQIVPILDNLHRALAQQSTDYESLKQGVEMIAGQFQEVLKNYGLEEIEAVGQPFDPNLHEAILEVEHQEYAAGLVVEEMEKGYQMRDKVLRPSRVVVSKGKK
jgi:molecular chaperone GrpE